MEDDFRLGIMMAMILLCAGLLAIVLWINKPPPRQHLFYCYNESNDSYFQCIHGDQTIISVTARSP